MPGNSCFVVSQHRFSQGLQNWSFQKAGSTNSVKYWGESSEVRRKCTRNSMTLGSTIWVPKLFWDRNNNKKLFASTQSYFSLSETWVLLLPRTPDSPSFDQITSLTHNFQKDRADVNPGCGVSTPGRKIGSCNRQWSAKTGPAVPLGISTQSGTEQVTPRQSL